MLTAKVHVFSDSVCCTGPGARAEKSASDDWKKEEHVMKRQSKEIVGHVCPGDTPLQVQQSIRVGTQHKPETFPDKIIFPSMFNDITSWESPTIQTQCLTQAVKK